MLSYVYILYSPDLNVNYVGTTTIKPEERLERHLKKHYGKEKFTARTDDWEILMSFECDSKSQALCIERHIKRMKSKVYISNLRKYPEIISKLKEKYGS